MKSITLPSVIVGLALLGCEHPTQSPADALDMISSTSARAEGDLPVFGEDEENAFFPKIHRLVAQAWWVESTAYGRGMIDAFANRGHLGLELNVVSLDGTAPTQTRTASVPLTSTWPRDHIEVADLQWPSTADCGHMVVADVSGEASIHWLTLEGLRIQTRTVTRSNIADDVQDSCDRPPPGDGGGGENPGGGGTVWCRYTVVYTDDGEVIEVRREYCWVVSD